MKLKLFIVIILLTSCYDEITINSQLMNYNNSSSEIELLRLINEYRISNGKNSLQLVNHISFKASEHNIYMIDNSVVNHDNFSQRANNIMQTFGAVSVGENIAYNYSTPNSVLNAWINSKEHKYHLDKNYTHIGVSINKKYYTVIFCTTP